MRALPVSALILSSVLLPPLLLVMSACEPSLAENSRDAPSPARTKDAGTSSSSGSTKVDDPGKPIITPAEEPKGDAGTALFMPRLSTGEGHTCIILSEGRLKCFGDNAKGQLGLGDAQSRGDKPGQLGDKLPVVNLGKDRRAVEVGLESDYTCVRLDQGDVKCWGGAFSGRLGRGDDLDRGAKPDDMGDALAPIPLGGAATQITLGIFHVCALLQGGSVKCWGYNSDGELGIGDTVDRGDMPNQMGSALPAVNLGAGRSAKKIVAGNFHTCAILDNGGVKCWGWNVQGQLGYGDTTARGGTSAQMGNALPAVDLGTGRQATDIAAGGTHTCALLDNGSLKCWGRNNVGQLGIGDANNRGATANQMGNMLPPVNLGTGLRALVAFTGISSSCTLLDTGDVKCWGENLSGELGLGNKITHGESPARTGDNLPTVNVGSGRKVLALTIREHHACAVLDDYKIKCWGDNAKGQLGLGDTTDRGTAPGQMGDALPALVLE